jgi:hypothetical protein
LRVCSGHMANRLFRPTFMKRSATPPILALDQPPL